MAITNTLRARLEVLGGKELIDLFDKIGDSAEKGFDRIDREAEQATKEVKKLERELKALDRIAKNIRAKIKVDKDRTPNSSEAAALGLADDIDRRTSAIRRQIAALDDVAALTRGDGARILGTQGDKDLLTIRETTRGLDELIGDGRRDGLFGDILPDADLDRILAASERIRAENDRFFDSMGSRIAAADQAEKERTSRSIPKPAADEVDPVKEEKKAAAEEARRKREADREERIRQAQERRAEQAAKDAKRDQDYRDHIARERQRIDDEIKRSREKLARDVADNRTRLERDLAAQRARIDAERTANNDQLARERQAHRDQLSRARQDQADEITRINRKHQDEINRLNTDHTNNLRRERSDFLRTLGQERSRARAQLGRERAQFTTDLANQRAAHDATLVRERADFTSQQTRDRRENAARLNAERIAHRDELNRQRLAHDAALAAEQRRFRDLIDRERTDHINRLNADRTRIRQLNADLDALRRAFDGINRSGRRFGAAGPSIGRVAKGLGRTFVDAARDVGRFGTALRQLEYAVGNTALRAGIGALLGVIGAGLAALGGAAALGGIAAISALAAFNAQKLENAARSVGQSLEIFTAMKYAAGSKGVAYDEYLDGIGALREAMAGILKEDEAFAQARDIFLKTQIPLRSADGKDLANSYQVLRRMSEVIKALPNDTVRIEFLTSIGGDPLAKLLPMLIGGPEALDAAGFRAIELGVVLTSQQVAELKGLAVEFYDMWQIIIGLSYKLAHEIMPDLIPVLKAINGWMLANQQTITDKLVGAFNWLIEVTKDFWKLWNQGSDADVMHKWTATFWYACEQIIAGFNRVWNVIEKGYRIAEPTLTKLSDYFGMSGPLEVALTFLAGQLLGLSNLVLSFAGVGIAAVRIVTNALKNLLWPIASGVLGTVAGIIGWPLLLAAGIGAVIMYWDDIEKLFTMAWAKFKETFPKTAEFLEDAFGDALAKVRTFTTGMVSNFRQRFPQLTKFFDDTRVAIESLWESIQNFNWGLVFEGLSDLGLSLLERLAETLETLAPILDYLVTNTLASAQTILEAINDYWTNSKAQGEIDGRIAAELQMPPEMFKAYKAMVGETELERQYRGKPLLEDVVDQMIGRSSPQSPVSSATQLPQNAAPASQTPVVVNLSNGDTILMVTPEDNVAERLGTYSRTGAAASPSWNR